MAHCTTPRRNLAATDPKTSMDPTIKKQPKSAPFTTITTAAMASTTKPHEDPTSDASSTIHTISKKFSKLYPNHHKGLQPSISSNPPSNSSTDNQFQSKSMARSVNEDASCKSPSKSTHHCRKTAADMEKDRLRALITGAIVHKSSKKSDDGCDLKELFATPKSKNEKNRKLSKKGREQMESHEGCDIKMALVSLSRSHEFELKEAHEKGIDMNRASFSLPGSGGRRVSFCKSQTELGDFLSCNGVKVVSVDMPPFMQVHAVDCARKTHNSLEKFTSKTLALILK